MSKREQPINRIQHATTGGEVLELSDVARLLRVHPITIRRMRRAGKFPKPFQVGSGSDRWLRTDIETWMRQGGVSSVDFETGLQVRSEGAERVERRYSTGRGLTTRVAGGRRVMSGYGAVFYRAGDAGTQYELAPGMFERINSHAFDRALRENPDVLCHFNHSPDLMLGRTGAGTLRLSVDSVGLRYEVDLPDTQAGNDVWTLAQRGDISGSSFSFSPVEDEKTVDGDMTILDRLDVDLFELGPVINPAYKATTATTAAASDGGRSRADADQVAVQLTLMRMEEDDIPEPVIQKPRLSSRQRLMEKISADCRRLSGSCDRILIENVTTYGGRRSHGNN